MRETPVLVVGHYCHDTLIHANGSRSEALGGSAAYISSVLSALDRNFSVVSKVGSDFAYASQVIHPPRVIPFFKTTQFIADFTRGERVETVSAVCEAIYPEDLPENTRVGLGLAVGIVGEVLPQTLEKLASCSRLVLCDMQGLIRTIDPQGRVRNRLIQDTPFEPLLEKVSFLKASRQEAKSMNLDQVRRKTCILVTEGKEGCTVLDGDREFHVPAFSVEEVDPTGAGDCFLAGFTAGLLNDLPLERAVLMGNYFGALAVQHVGVPKLKGTEVQDFSSGLPRSGVECSCI